MLAFRDLWPSRTAVYHWFAEIKRYRGSIEDELRDGRPKKTVPPENIGAVQKLEQEDTKITVHEIQKSLSNGKGSAIII